MKIYTEHSVMVSSLHLTEKNTRNTLKKRRRLFFKKLVPHVLGATHHPSFSNNFAHEILIILPHPAPHQSCSDVIKVYSLLLVQYISIPTTKCREDFFLEIQRRQLLFTVRLPAELLVQYFWIMVLFFFNMFFLVCLFPWKYLLPFLISGAACKYIFVLLLNFPGLFNVTDVVWKDIYSDTMCVSSSLNIWYLQYLYNLSPPPHSTPTHQNITIYNKSTNVNWNY